MIYPSEFFGLANYLESGNEDQDVVRPPKIGLIGLWAKQHVSDWTSGPNIFISHHCDDNGASHFACDWEAIYFSAIYGASSDSRI